MDSKVLLPLIISEIRSGNSPSQICKKHNIKKQNLNYYLRKLKNTGAIEKIEYGIWKVLKEVKETTKANVDKKEIRGHGFNWRVRLRRKYDWGKHLNKRGIPYKMIGLNSSTPRIIFRNKKIWLTQTGMVVYEPLSFFEEDGISAKKTAVYELKNTIESLGRKLSINFDGQWDFTTSREHFGQIKNALARQCNKDGEKIYIRDDRGLWLWIDDSHSLSELETNNPITSKQVQDWYNNHKKNKFRHTGDYIDEKFVKVMDVIGGLAETQEMVVKSQDMVVKAQVMDAKNIIKHQKVLDDMLLTMQDIRSSLKDIRDTKNKQ